jgi:hypothetical protein
MYLRGEKHRIERRGRREGFAELVVATARRILRILVLAFVVAACLCGLHTNSRNLIRAVFRTREIGMSPTGWTRALR